MIKLGQLRGMENCRLFHQFFKYRLDLKLEETRSLKYWTMFLLRERGKSEEWPLCCSGFHTPSSLRKETETFPSGLGITV